MSRINSNSSSSNFSLDAGSPTATAPSAGDMASWYEAMSMAWGNVLDGQATKIMTMAEDIGNGGGDKPSAVALLTAESLKMQFLSSNAATSTNSVGQALESLARK